MPFLVSFIIPVYNAEKYIENCLKSVTNQTYGNLEIVCIDDGSKDSSSTLIKELSDKDSRIKYVFQENSGVAAARNNGLSQASGDFIIFLDSDDYIHPQTVELMLDCQSKSDADIVCCKDIHTSRTDEKSEKIDSYDFIYPEYDYLLGDESGRLCRCVWGKLIKAGVAKKYKFPSGLRTGEDSYYMLSMLNDIPKIALIQKDLWFYYINESSLSRSVDIEAEADFLRRFDTLFADIQHSKSDSVKAYTLQAIYKSFFRLRSCCFGNSSRRALYKDCKSRVRKLLKTMLTSSYIRPKNKIMYSAFYFSRQIYEKIFTIHDPTMKNYYKNLRQQIKSRSA